MHVDMCIDLVLSAFVSAGVKVYHILPGFICGLRFFKILIASMGSFYIKLC